MEISLARHWHTFGGRQIENPLGGGHRRPPNVCPGHCNRTDLRGRTLGVCTLKMVSLLSLFSPFGIFGIIDCWRDSWRAYLEETFQKSAKISTKSSLGGSQIEPWSLQNRVWSLPRRHFQKTSNLRRQKNGCGVTFERHFGPTWLQLGGPRPSKIEAET